MRERRKEEHNIPPVELVTPVAMEYPAGLYMGKLLRELKENGKLLATVCKKCRRIMFPPQCVCSICHAENLEDPEWVEVGPRGTLAGFMKVTMPSINPRNLELGAFEYPIGTITPDAPEGKFCSLWHFVGEPDISKLKVGMRLEMVLKPKEERVGLMEDILYWKPIEE